MAESKLGRNLGLAALGIGVVAIAAIIVLSWRSEPQMGTHEESYRTVDALYTAVRNRDAKGRDAAEVRLIAYREAGAFPANASKRLREIIALTRQGEWELATRKLYAFMNAQRRI